MNWNAIGATGEILAAVAVVVTLLYLAKQIRQNSQAVQMFFDCAESYRTLSEDHRIEKDVGVLASIVARRICENGFREWWSDNQADDAPRFAAWINGIIAAQR